MRSPLPVRLSRSSKSVTYLLRYRLIGSVAVLTSRNLTSVAQYALLTALRHQDQIVVRFQAIPLVFSSIGQYYTLALQATVLQITFIYTSLVQSKLHPYADTVSLVRANYQVANFYFIVLRWPFYLSLQSIQTLRNRASQTRVIVCQLRQTYVISAIYIQVRQTSLLFSRVNSMPRVRAYQLQVYQAPLRCQRVSSISLLKARRFRLLAKLTTMRLAQSWSQVQRLEVQRRKKISESSNPQGTLVVTWYRSVDSLLKNRLAIRPLRKLLTYQTIQGGKPWAQRVQSSLVQLTVSNAPLMLSYRRLATTLQYYVIYVALMTSLIVRSIKYSGQLLIQVSKKRSLRLREYRVAQYS